MKRKANPVEAAPLPTCTAVGPEDMVLVACASGEVFLVERNCATASSYCRDAMQLWEGAVRRAAANTRTEDSAPGDGAVSESPVVLRIAVESQRRDGNGPLATDPVEIPFMPFLTDDVAGSPTAPLAGLRHVPVAVVAEHYQQRVEATESPSKGERPSSKPISSYADRKAAHVVVPKPISPLAPIEGHDGALLYPVVVVPYVTPALMEAALSYGQRKYKLDVDGEKGGAELAPPVLPTSPEDRWALMAASVLTGM